MIKKLSESKNAEARHWSVDDALDHLKKIREKQNVKKIIILYVDDKESHNYIVAGTANKTETI